MGQHHAEAWQAAMEALLLLVEHDGPVLMARMPMVQALHRARQVPMQAAPIS
jgi:hypothetical protein